MCLHWQQWETVREGFERLCRAIEEIDEEKKQANRDKILPRKDKSIQMKDVKGMKAMRKHALNPMKQLMSMSLRRWMRGDVCLLEESIGRISAEFDICIRRESH